MMSFGSRVMQAYFNYVYNPVYDFTIARLNRYRQLQERCVGKLELEDKDRVLCVGLGTGNEIIRILEMNRNLDIVGVDYSPAALRKAYQKALLWGKEIKVLTMDARSLEFATGSFDKIICLHVMDFVKENEQVTGEILRVLKDGGQFVITYPSVKEGNRLGYNLLKDGIGQSINSGNHGAIAFLGSLIQMLAGIVYLPLFLRPNKKSYLRGELEAMVGELAAGDFEIEEDTVYQDFVVYGRK